MMVFSLVCDVVVLGIVTAIAVYLLRETPSE